MTPLFSLAWHDSKPLDEWHQGGKGKEAEQIQEMEDEAAAAAIQAFCQYVKHFPPTHLT